MYLILLTVHFSFLGTFKWNEKHSLIRKKKTQTPFSLFRCTDIITSLDAQPLRTPIYSHDDL